MEKGQLKYSHFQQTLTNNSYRDTLVPLKWGKETFDNLQDHGVNGTFVPVRNTMHELKKSELLQLKDWIVSVLPPLESDLTNKL